MKITQEKLKEVLHYDPDSGKFTWIVKRSGTKKNKEAGSPDHDGYILIRIDYVLYKAHRLAFLYMTGKFPECIVDHKDGNTSNNKWTNLREATYSQNLHNSKLNSNNTSGIKGVWWDRSRKKWVAEIKINYKKKHLGRFRELEDAKNARKKAEETFIFHN